MAMLQSRDMGDAMKAFIKKDGSAPEYQPLGPAARPKL